MAFTVRQGIITTRSELITDGPNVHIRATLMCTDGPANTFYIVIMNDAASRLSARFESGDNPTLVVAGHLHSWTDEHGEAQVELALIHLGVSFTNEFIYPNETDTPST